MLFDASKSEIDVWVDDREIPGLHLTDWKQAVYDTARFGYEKYAGPDADIWYDDIAIGAEHIGCQITGGRAREHATRTSPSLLLRCTRCSCRPPG